MGALGVPDQRASEAVDARQEIDLRIGAAFTRWQTLRLRNKFADMPKLLSYGPCQFPTLGFVVDRYWEREGFEAEKFWSIQVGNVEYCAAGGTVCSRVLVAVMCAARGGGGGAKKIRGITVFSYPPPLGGVRPGKKYPPPMCKKVSQPQFFSKERHTDHLLEATGCCFIWCKCRLHNALRSPNIPHSTGTNLVAPHVFRGPKFSHHKARVLAVGPQEFWLGVKFVKMAFRFF